MRLQAARSPFVLAIASVVLAALAVSFAWRPGVTVGALAAAYLLMLVAVARAARERGDGTALAAVACVLGVTSVLLIPLTFGLSLCLAAVVLPLALPGLTLRGPGRWLAVLALLLNAALTALLALIWFV